MLSLTKEQFYEAKKCAETKADCAEVLFGEYITLLPYFKTSKTSQADIEREATYILFDVMCSEGIISVHIAPVSPTSIIIITL